MQKGKKCFCYYANQENYRKVAEKKINNADTKHNIKFKGTDKNKIKKKNKIIKLVNSFLHKICHQMWWDEILLIAGYSLTEIT